MSRVNHQDIRIGTLASMGKGVDYIKQIHQHGFESYELTLWAGIDDVDLERTAKEIRDYLGDSAVIGGIGVYGNPLTVEKTAHDFGVLIQKAHLFGTNVVCGFAGAQEDRNIEENMPRFKEVWGPLTKMAEDNGVKIAFENCDMGGTWEAPKWNIAHSPRAWEMMFNEVDSPNIGLEWEPCHQMCSCIDPLPQLVKWLPKVHHIHGKDATIRQDLLKEYGTRSGKYWAFHRTPGFGDTNWADLITILRQGNWTGSIDIEGWHDPVYRDELEMTGQVYGLNYLKACRGGAFIPNPVD